MAKRGNGPGAAADLLSCEEVAREIGVSRWTVWRFLVQNGRYALVTSSGRRYVLKRDLAALRRAMGK